MTAIRFFCWTMMIASIVMGMIALAIELGRKP
jgi:hypothetical protein